MEECKQKKTNQEIRKGSSKLLKTLIIKFSLVTDSICGPGNCPLIKIPWKKESKNTTKDSCIIHLQAKQEMGTTLIQKWYLLLHSKRPNVTIGDIPCIKPIWVLAIDAAQAQNQEQESEWPEESDPSHSLLKQGCVGVKKWNKSPRNGDCDCPLSLKSYGVST